MNSREYDAFYKAVDSYLVSSIYAEPIKLKLHAFTREELEHCETSITDKDMLQLQIDAALDAKDKELFMQLTAQLKGLEVVTV